ncbi:pectinesterase family protein [Alteromonas gilva]|uniref:Pectinesterase family protein n=1 Tax=Alteromonas gilva TaxID=2987522 RepID=A0ABT5KZJ7_9ALTE|nr:pectinesterase family protein [Alteromonas gilva]MDC8829691.1 pectinesterase family protein [Alteromonas gilva]
MKHLNRIAAVFSGVVLVTGCGFEQTTNVKEPPAPSLTGQFVDAPVGGLSYSSESFPDGTTNANGEFDYFRGDQITFSIGDLVFPSAPASSLLTPLALFKTDNPFNPSVVNTLRLLQALDTDADPSNGISISPDAAAAATMPLADGETIESFFAQDAADFAADVEPWLASVGGSATLVDYDTAVAHFVNYLETEYGTLLTNAINVELITGTLYNTYIAGNKAIKQAVTFTPDDAGGLTGTFTLLAGETTTTGTYNFAFGRRALVLTTDTSTHYLVSRSFNTVDEVYSLCWYDNPSQALTSLVRSCDADSDPKDNLLVLSEEQADLELIALEEQASSVEPALAESFDTDINTFFSSGYKRLTDDPNSGPMYFKTGGNPLIDPSLGQLTLAGARFTIGNAAANPGAETAESDTVGTGIFNISQGFTLSFDVIDHNGSGSMNLYVDNNTTSQGKSVHGGASKFVGMSVNAENLPIGQRFTYTYEPGTDVSGLPVDDPDARILDATVTNSFFQLRTDSSASVTIDNLTIETVADAVDVPEPPPEEPEEPAPEQPDIPQVALPLSFDYIGVTEDIFSDAFASLLNSNGETLPLYARTGGSVTVVAEGLEIDSGRFTIGNATPEVETTGDDTINTGALDLSRPYKVVMDIVSVNDTEGNNKFQIYVDNNTSSSSKSIHGSASRFYSELINTLEPGTTLEVEGFLASENSFLQLRTESGGTVVINNLRIEYIEDTTVFACADQPSLYFCDDFSSASTDNWVLLAQPDNSEGAVGSFDILNDNGNKMLRYTAGSAGGEILQLTEAAMASIPDSADYFVEARIRPRQNSTTANKQLYFTARYDSTGNWYGGGLNLQNSSSNTRVEIAVSTDGSISRPLQAKTPLLLGEKDATDGVWYRVRFELVGETLTAYLDGENMGSVTDATFTAKGLIGMFTNNRSFEMDDFKVGDPSVKPVQLTLDFKDPAWNATTTTEPLLVYVTAIQDDGITDDSYTVTTSNESVVSVSVDGPNVTLTPVAAGSAVITFTSGSDPTLVRDIEVLVTEGFVMPTSEYGDLTGKVSPALNANNAYIDARLTLTFDTPPTLGDVGEVRIYNAADDTVADVITLGGDIDTLGYPDQDRLRRVNYRPFSIEGSTLTIVPHSNALDYDKTYYVAIGDGVVTDTALNGVSFAGMGKSAGWQFSTKEIGPSGTDITVDDDGVADFRTVQGALSYVMQNVAKDTSATITVKAGMYNELLYLRNKNNLTIQGEDRDNTVIYYDNYESFNGGTGGSEPLGGGTPNGGRSVFLVESADMLVLNNFTLKNSHILNNTDSNQAETIYFNSNHRLVANNMNFTSEQDTLLLKGYSWFYNSLVAGNVDFIWGYPTAAVFEESEIRTIGNSKYGANAAAPGGYVLQARVPNADDPGFVFLNSDFTHGPGPLGTTVEPGSTYIARSGGNSSYFDNITLINNTFGEHIAASGWAYNGINGQPQPNPDPATANAGWREYGSMNANGEALDLSVRAGGYILAESETTGYTSRATIFAGYNGGEGWEPQPVGVPVIVEEVADTGFAGDNFDITGGAGGMTVTVDTGAKLTAALADAKAANSPVTIYVDGVITDANNDGSGRSIDIKDMDNVSIIGVADRGEFDGIGIAIRRANNIIIQNLKIHHVLTGGKDAISIEGDNDGSTTSNIWIDHNELYSTLDVDKDYYDGLIDSKSGARNITISYNYLHDHWKGSLHGHTDNDTNSDNTDRLITFHHNRFENIESRLPLFRFGYGHLYNNYYNNISSTAINSRMGAELQIENNVFENTQNPIVSFYSAEIGYWNTSGNLFGTGVTWTTPSGNDVVAGPDAEPTSSYVVPYEYTMDETSVVKSKVINNAGVGKIDQSGLDIPAIGDNGAGGGSGGNDTGTDVTLPYSEDFSADSTDAFFSAAYKSLPADSSVPLHAVTGGGSGISITDGQISLDSARFTIGDTQSGTDTADTDTGGRGVFDLSRPYKVLVDIVSVSDPDGDNNFQLYVDNNTSSSSKSVHGGSSKFFATLINDLTIGTLEVEGPVATANSFIQLRTESGGTVTLDNLRIEYTD